MFIIQIYIIIFFLGGGVRIVLNKNTIYLNNHESVQNIT